MLASVRLISLDDKVSGGTIKCGEPSGACSATRVFKRVRAARGTSRPGCVSSLTTFASSLPRTLVLLSSLPYDLRKHQNGLLRLHCALSPAASIQLSPATFRRSSVHRSIGLPLALLPFEPFHVVTSFVQRSPVGLGASVRSLLNNTITGFTCVSGVRIRVRYAIQNGDEMTADDALDRCKRQENSLYVHTGGAAREL
ncbi:hypothetical protein EVAR_76515_1 [Eumeta japonica]|uniref:Uncharacterized protein n=1 Tax=Eumeta variegata TaxID=151549 RepID=A0A4C1T5T5_EUMVA|nr:hypothetical protein EVAR_76515_1 [Eumeta japonica]